MAGGQGVFHTDSIQTVIRAALGRVKSVGDIGRLLAPVRVRSIFYVDTACLVSKESAVISAVRGIEISSGHPAICKIIDTCLHAGKRAGACSRRRVHRIQPEKIVLVPGNAACPPGALVCCYTGHEKRIDAICILTVYKSASFVRHQRSCRRFAADHSVQRVRTVGCTAPERKILVIVIVRIVRIDRICTGIVLIVRDHHPVICVKIVAVIAVVFDSCAQIRGRRAVIQPCPVAGCGHRVHDTVEKSPILYLITAHYSGLRQVNDLHLRCVDPANHAGHHKFYFSTAGPKVGGISAVVTVCVTGDSCAVLCVLCDRVVLRIEVHHLDR